MNKIKAKINNSQQFTPWEESFRDLYNTLQISKRRKAQYRLSTISPKQSSLETSQKNPSKHLLNRNLLNISKINLHTGQQAPNKPVFNQSRRYFGPRVTFYAKMNPRGNRFKSVLQIDQQIFKQTQILSKQHTGRIVRDQSIKYLDIIEQDNVNQPKQNKSRYLLPNNFNNHQLQRTKSKKMDQQHSYLRRLKVIYNSRKQ